MTDIILTAVLYSDDTLTVERETIDDMGDGEQISFDTYETPGAWAAMRTTEDLEKIVRAQGIKFHASGFAEWSTGMNEDGDRIECMRVSGQEM